MLSPSLYILMFILREREHVCMGEGQREGEKDSQVACCVSAEPDTGLSFSGRDHDLSRN